MLQFFLASSPIFAVAGLGFASARFRLVTPAGFAAFATYAFDLALPALVTSLLARQALAEAFDSRFFAALLGAGLAVFLATGALTAALGRPGLRVVGAHAQAATTGNLGFLGVPLLLTLLGERAAGPLAMGILAEVGLLMPLGIVLMSLGRDRSGAPRSVLREVAGATLGNPIVLGVCAGAAPTTGANPRRPSCTRSSGSGWSRSSPRPGNGAPTVTASPPSSNGSFAPTWTAASSPGALHGYAVPTAVSSAWSPSPARPTSAPPATHDAWRTPPSTSSATCSRRSPCGSGSSPSPGECDSSRPAIPPWLPVCSTSSPGPPSPGSAVRLAFEEWPIRGPVASPRSSASGAPST